MPSITQDRDGPTRKRKRCQPEHSMSEQRMNKPTSKTERIVAYSNLTFDMTAINNAFRVFSDRARQRLLAAYECSFNSHLPLLTIEKLQTLEDRKDQRSRLLYATVLATGLLHVEDSDPECQLQRTGEVRRSRLHEAIRDTIDKNDLSADNGNHAQTMLLFSELERSAGLVGSANMCLREAARMLSETQDSELYTGHSSDKDDLSDTTAMLCELLLHQWSIIGPYRQLPTRRLVDSKAFDVYGTLMEMPNVRRDELTTASLYAHCELLRISKNLTWDAASRTVSNASSKLAKRLQRWYTELPSWLRWQHRTENWQLATFLLHLQYQAIMALVDPSKVVGLVNAISEYERRYSLRNAPLIVAHHIEVALSFLGPDSDPSNRLQMQASHTTHKLVQMLLVLSERYAVVLDIMSRIRTRHNAEVCNRVQATGATIDMKPDLFDVDYANLNFSELNAESQDLPRFLEEQGLPAHSEEQDFQGNLTGQAASRSPSFDLGENILICLNDPVFGGYIDELGHNTSQSGELWKQSVQTGKRGRPDHISSETWRGNDIAEQLRAFLGHDMGIRGPGAVNGSLQEPTDESQRDVQPHMQTMTI